MENLKRTALYEEHIKKGAKMVPFAGWEMPIQYTGIISEHNAVRKNAGIFDVSHMGQLFIEGNEAVDLIQKLVPQDISKLNIGKAVYTQLTNQKAGIIDDLIIYKLDEKKYLLIVNASRIEMDFDWIEFNLKNEKFLARIDNQSDKLSIIAVQGPLSQDIIEEIGLPKNEQPIRFTIKQTKLNNSDVLIARTGYTGEDGFEIIVDNAMAPALWVKIIENGDKYNIKPIGLGARDTLRLEASMLLYGQDMDDKTTPVEASLGWSVSKDKEADYWGKKIILSQLKDNTHERVLVGFRMMDKFIPRHGYEVWKDNEKVGIVTSGGVALALGLNIGLGYISSNTPSLIGTKLEIKIRDKFHPAEIVKRPFYTRNMR